MEQLYQRFSEKYIQTNPRTLRSCSGLIDWSNRMIGLKGARGVGKTTLLMQHLKKNYKNDGSILYASLDHLYFANNNLYELANIFSKQGGQLLVLDEVHRYSNWSQELKNIYDDFNDLNIIFTGSSLLQLRKASADLSRRAVMYKLDGLSFREYLQFELKESFRTYDLDEILNNHIDIASSIVKHIKPIAFFKDYLKFGYYPFYLENKKTYNQKLAETIQLVLEIDIPQFEKIQISHIILLKRLMQIICTSAPFKPNFTAISKKIGISINTLKKYVALLNDASLVEFLYSSAKSMNNVGKPAKIYLDNPNLMYALAGDAQDIGNIRESFFINQVGSRYNISESEYGDFKVENKYNFEIGGKSKSRKQVAGIKDSFVVQDNIEIGYNNKIPLWLFGFLY